MNSKSWKRCLVETDRHRGNAAIAGSVEVTSFSFEIPQGVKEGVKLKVPPFFLFFAILAFFHHYSEHQTFLNCFGWYLFIYGEHWYRRLSI